MRKTIRKTIFILGCIFISTQLTSCFALLISETGKNNEKQAYKKASVEKGAIPPEFGDNPNETLIIVIEDYLFYDKRTKKNTGEVYSGKHEFATMDELKENEKYSDLKKYRYYFYYDNDAYNVDRDEYLKKFYVYDRLEEKKYSHSISAMGWIKYQKGYLKSLNDHLQK